MNIKLVRPSDFNEKLRERELDRRVTVQKICRDWGDENDVRFVLNEIWVNPSKAQKLLGEAISMNVTAFELEKLLAK